MSNNPILFRCSSLGKLMTEPQSKADKEAGRLSKTSIAYLDEFIALYKYGRQKPFTNKYVQKGTAVEKDSMDLYCDVYGVFCKKNQEWFNDGTIGGTPDIILKDKVIDLKSSWQLSTFLAQKEVPKDYFWQLCGYARLLNLTKAELVFGLVNTPENLIDRELKTAYYNNQMNELSDDEKSDIAINMIFTQQWYDKNDSGLVKRNDFWDVMKQAYFPDAKREFIEIPAEKRIKKFEIEFTDEDFKKLDSALEKSIQYVEDNYNNI